MQKNIQCVLLSEKNQQIPEPEEKYVYNYKIALDILI